MSLTCGLCHSEIQSDDAAFHLSGKCELAKDILTILERDAEHHGLITQTLERIIEKALGRHGRLAYLSKV